MKGEIHISAIIKKIAQFLVSNWNKIPGAVQWAIQQIAGSAIVEAVSRGVSAVIDVLSDLGSAAIEKIADLLGL